VSTLDIDVLPPNMRTTTEVDTSVGCANGMPIGRDLTWVHIQDTTQSLRTQDSSSSETSISAYAVLSESFAEIRSSVAIPHDKPSVCDGQGLNCECGYISSTHSDADIFASYLSPDFFGESHLYMADNYPEIPARTSLFDPLIVMNSPFGGSENRKDGKWDLRVVSIMTDKCSRTSGRDDKIKWTRNENGFLRHNEPFG